MPVGGSSSESLRAPPLPARAEPPRIAPPGACGSLTHAFGQPEPSQLRSAGFLSLNRFELFKLALNDRGLARSSKTHGNLARHMGDGAGQKGHRRAPTPSSSAASWCTVNPPYTSSRVGSTKPRRGSNACNNEETTLKLKDLNLDKQRAIGSGSICSPWQSGSTRSSPACGA
jgi:hypothetical protein